MQLTILFLIRYPFEGKWTCRGTHKYKGSINIVTTAACDADAMYLMHHSVSHQEWAHNAISATMKLIWWEITWSADPAQLSLQHGSRKPHVPGYAGGGKKRKEKHCFNSALNSCRGTMNKEPVVSGVLESVLCLNTAVYKPAGAFKSMPARERMSLWNTKKDEWMDVAYQQVGG